MQKSLVSIFVVALAAWAAPADAAVKASDVIDRAIDGFVRPAYATFHEEAASADKAVAALCKDPSQANLDAARAKFADLVKAWSQAEIIQFGPITEDNRLERILYWPDRKSIGLKQVQAAIAGEDKSAADAATLHTKSVAMQGLGALEYILYGTGADDLAGKDGAYRCAFGAAVAGNIDNIAMAVDAEWAGPDGFAKLWNNPGPDNPVYRDGTESVTELMEVFINGLEMVRDVRVKGFLGDKPDADKPKGAIFWRSDLTGTSLAGNLEGMDRLFEASHVGDALSGDAHWMADSTHILLANGVAEAFAAGRKTLVATGRHLKRIAIRDRFRHRLPERDPHHAAG